MTETKPRPTTLSGHNYKLDLEHGHLFITINHSDGEPFEIFGWQGKAGSQTYGMTEALGKMVTLHLRRGTPVKEIVDGLDNIGEIQPWPNSWMGDGVVVKGIADGFAKCLKWFVEHHEVEEPSDDLLDTFRDIALEAGIVEQPEQTESDNSLLIEVGDKLFHWEEVVDLPEYIPERLLHRPREPQTCTGCIPWEALQRYPDQFKDHYNTGQCLHSYCYSVKRADKEITLCDSCTIQMFTKTQLQGRMELLDEES